MLQIFEIRKDYIADLQKIYLEVRQKTFHWLDDIIDYKLTDFDRDTESEFVLVALYNDNVAGFISLWLPGNFIHHLYLDEEYQGKNIGTALLDEAIKIMNSPITLKCLVKNSKAVKFYQSKGFIAKEKGVSNHGDYILYELKK